MYYVRACLTHKVCRQLMRPSQKERERDTPLDRDNELAAQSSSSSASLLCITTHTQCLSSSCLCRHVNNSFCVVVVVESLWSECGSVLLYVGLSLLWKQLNAIAIIGAESSIGQVEWFCSRAKKSPILPLSLPQQHDIHRADAFSMKRSFLILPLHS